MPRVIHFEVHAEDPQNYSTITTGPDGHPGINGGLIRRRGSVDGQAVIAYVCTVDVPSVEEYVGKIAAHGGTIVVPKMPIPGVGWLAYGKDTEGNILGVMEADPKAH